MTALQRALHLIETGEREPLDWHVLWLFRLNSGRLALFTERERMLDTVELGHPTQESAERHVREHRYHRRHGAWLFNLRTGDVVKVPANDRTMHTP